MNGEDDIIREALKLEINASDEINRKILQSAEPKRTGYGFLRIAVTVAVCLIAFMGTATVVNAATGGKLFKALREKLARWTYVFENGSKTVTEIVEKDGETWERVTFIQDDVSFMHPISEKETVYELYLRIIDRYGRRCFMLLNAGVTDEDTPETMYYEIRGEFYSQIAEYQDADEKEQILRGLREAAKNTDVAEVKNGLLDLATDYENNRRIFSMILPGRPFGEKGYLAFFEDLTELPTGEAIIIADPADDRQKSRIFTVWIDEVRLTVNTSSFEIFSEEAYRELIESGKTVYDLRKAK